MVSGEKKCEGSVAPEPLAAVDLCTGPTHTICLAHRGAEVQLGASFCASWIQFARFSAAFVGWFSTCVRSTTTQGFTAPSDVGARGTWSADERRIAVTSTARKAERITRTFKGSIEDVLRKKP